MKELNTDKAHRVIANEDGTTDVWFLMFHPPVTEFGQPREFFLVKKFDTHNNPLGIFTVDI